jgi:hypothetical protein
LAEIVSSDLIAAVKSSAVINTDLSVAVILDDKAVPAKQYEELFKGPLQLMSQLINVMARVKSWTEDVTSRSVELNVQLVITALEDGLEQLNDRASDQQHSLFVWLLYGPSTHIGH